MIPAVNGKPSPSPTPSPTPNPTVWSFDVIMLVTVGCDVGAVAAPMFVDGEFKIDVIVDVELKPELEPRFAVGDSLIP